MQRSVYMKKLIAMTALCFCFSSALADTPAQVQKFFKSNSLQLEAQSSDLNTDTKLSDVDWNFKFTLNTAYNDYVYSKIDVVKMSNDYSYGATVGVQDPFASFTPYSEISYNHQNTSKKLLTSDQFDYGTGVKLNYFSRLSPFLEANDFLDADRWFVKTGLQFKVDDRFSLIGDFSFPSKLHGSRCGLGIGVAF